MCLLGRNGRGKTTTIKTHPGLAPVAAGRIVFDGHGHHAPGRPTGSPRRGFAWVPDNRRIFPTLTASGTCQWRSTAPCRAAAGERWTLERVYARFPILAPPPAPRGEHLSGGEAQLVAIARAS